MRESSPSVHTNEKSNKQTYAGNSMEYNSPWFGPREDGLVVNQRM